RQAQILSEVMTLSYFCWLLRADQKEDPRVFISNCRNTTRQSCSMLVIRKVIANDTGYFTSFYGQLAAQITVPFRSLISKGAVLQINVIFPADYRNPFVEIHPEHPEIIYILDANRTIVIPCRVTLPDIKPKEKKAKILNIQKHSPTLPMYYY
uniref:Uncharacterized protein n=1 Tax=Strix occidentalis caurina TaxID=311401 RepID=A0A8D0F0J7_STROC